MKQDSGAEFLSPLPILPMGQAYLCFNERWRQTPSTDIVRFRTGPRTVPHIRHLHKYLQAPLPEPKRFYFHDKSGRALGRAAASLWEFREALSQLPVGSLQYHLQREDFESWVRNILHDQALARQISKLSRRNLTGEALRQALLEVVVNRYEELDHLA